MFWRNIAILQGDARQLPLPDKSVNLIVTSPPYYRLRSYKDKGEHYGGQIGSEDTPGQYLDHLWECAAEWARVLTDDGSMLIVLGDKYATRWSSVRQSGRAGLDGDEEPRGRSGRNGTGIPEKSLMMLPARFAIGCVDKLGLVQRAEIVWDKANSLPESVRDRVRRNHELVFGFGPPEDEADYSYHFTLQQEYYAATDLIREPHKPESLARSAPHRADVATHEDTHTMDMSRACHPRGHLPLSVWHIATVPLNVPKMPDFEYDHYAAFPPELARRAILGWSPAKVCLECGKGRFPVFERVRMQMRPSARVTAAKAAGEVPDRIPSGTPTQLPQARLLGYACACTPSRQSGEPRGPSWKDERPSRIGATGKRHSAENYPDRPERTEYLLDGWQPPPTRPGVVLDPMGGTGTTAITAALLGRRAITLDRSWDYGAKLVRWRMNDRAQMRAFLGGSIR